MLKIFVATIALVPVTAVANNLKQADYLTMLDGISHAMANGPKIETYDWLRVACAAVREVDATHELNGKKIQSYQRPMQFADCEKFEALTKM